MDSSAHSARTFLAALTLLVIGATLVFTLSPFDFSWPSTARFRWQTNFSDASSNVILFIPLGFLLRLLREESPPRLFLPELALAAGLSFLIEFAQLYLASRHSQYSDVLCNAAGAWLGAWLAHLTGARLSPTSDSGPSACASSPLYGLILATPVLWLYGFDQDLRNHLFIPSMLLALAGCIAISAFTTCLVQERRDITPAAASLFTMGWVLTAFFPFLRSHAVAVLWSALLLGLFSYLFTRHLARRERPIRIGQWLVPLVLLHLAATLPFQADAIHTTWHWNLNLVPLLERDHGVHLVGQMMLFLLLGYFRGAAGEPPGRKLLLRGITASLLPLTLLLLVGGFLSHSPFSLVELPLLSFSLAYGVMLDALRAQATAFADTGPMALAPMESR